MPKFFRDGGVADFRSPIQEPESDSQRQWQEANKSWWESHPMTYEWGPRVQPRVGTPEYFDAVDESFLAAAHTYMGPWMRPFDRLIPYDDIAELDVLEIGVGAGTHAEMLAGVSKSFTGVDITERAVALTQERLALRGLTGDIRQMDAEHLDFPDQSFDFVWSWGVIHHSARTSDVLAEITRVLRPGGKATFMVYHRSFWWWYVVNGFIRGILLGAFWRTRSLHRIVQESMDGAIARFYRPSEWRRIAPDSLPVMRIEIYGDKAEMLPLPPSHLKSVLLRGLPDEVCRLFLHHLRQGYFLVAHHQRA